VTSLGAGLEN